MAQIVKFPGEISRLGFKRVKRRARAPQDPNQLELFSAPTAALLSFVPDLSPFQAALLLDEHGDIQAEALYQRAIDEGDCVADAYCNLGIIESQKGNTSKAVDCLTNSLKHDPRHSEAHYNLANLYFELNDFRLAQIHYDVASQVDPSFANAYFNLALVHAINNDFPAAMTALTRYQALVPAAEARNAEALLQDLRRSFALGKHPRFGSP